MKLKEKIILLLILSCAAAYSGIILSQHSALVDSSDSSANSFRIQDVYFLTPVCFPKLKALLPPSATHLWRRQV